MTEDYLGFIGAVIGGAISGAIGFLIVWYTNSQQNKERLKNDVYRRLYRDVFNLNKNNFPASNVSIDSWSKIDPYELLNIEPRIRTEFESLSVEIENWNTHWNRLYYNYTRNDAKIKQFLQDGFKQNNLLNANGNIVIGDNTYSVERFLELYLLIIMNPHIKDSEDLFKLMYEFEQKYYRIRGSEMNYLKSNTPLFFDALFKQLPSIRQLCMVDLSYDGMISERHTIMERVTKLQEPLKKLAK